MAQEKKRKKVLKKFFLLFASLLFTIAGYSQDRQIPYGHNDSVGKYYAVRGIKMYTETYGTGRPLLLLHGNGGSIEAFAGIIPYFAKKYKVIAVDSRAQGRTRDDNDSLSFEMMADDFAALLTAMHIDSAYVLGWSDGGIDALELAMRHPDKVIKFASTGANLQPDTTGLIVSYVKREQQEYDNWQKRMPLTTTKERNLYKIFLLDWLQPHISLAALHEIHCPALVIGGDHDLIPVQQTVQIYQNIPNDYLWIVPNSGHATLVEHKKEFEEIVNNFFSKPFKRHGY